MNIFFESFIYTERSHTSIYFMNETIKTDVIGAYKVKGFDVQYKNSPNKSGGEPNKGFSGCKPHITPSFLLIEGYTSGISCV